MRKIFRNALFLLCVLALAACSDDGGSGSFDPDGIAHMENGIGVDFSRYDEVWVPENGSEGRAEGIVNVAWTLYGDDVCRARMFITDSGFAGGRYNLETPYYIYCEDGTDYYAGSFSLYRRGGSFVIRTEIHSRLNDNDEWVAFTGIKEERSYLVCDNKLVFID